MAIRNDPASGGEPVGVVGEVAGEVLIERGGERVPVLGGEQLFASDKLISVGDGRANVQFANLTKGGNVVSGSLMPGGEVVIKPMPPESAITNLNNLAAEGFEIVEVTPEDAMNQVQSTAMRAMMGALSTGAGVTELVGRATTNLVNPPASASEVLSEEMVPGLNISAARADAISPAIMHSAEMEMLSQAALQSVTVMSMGGPSQSAMPASSEKPSLMSGGVSPLLQEVSRPMGAELTRQTSAMDVASSFVMVSDIAAAAPAVMGKESTAEVLQSELSTALGLKQSEEAPVQAEVVEPVVKLASAERVLSAAANSVLPDALQSNIQSVEDTVKNVTGIDTPSIADPAQDNVGKLLQMIESFEAKLGDLTGLVYSAFEGVGPDVLVAKSDFSSVPTSQLVTDSVAGSGIVSNLLETALAPLGTTSSGSDLTSLASSIVPGQSASMLSGGLFETLSGLGADLSSIISVFDDLAAGSNSNPVNNVLGGVTDAVDNLLDGITGGGGGSGSGSGNPLDNLLDGITGGGGGSGSGSGNPLDNLLDGVTGGGGSGGSGGGTGLLDQLAGVGASPFASLAPAGLPAPDVGGLLGDLIEPGVGGLLNNPETTGGSSAAPSDAPAQAVDLPQQESLDLVQGLGSALSSAAGSDGANLPDTNGLL